MENVLEKRATELEEAVRLENEDAMATLKEANEEIERLDKELQEERDRQVTTANIRGKLESAKKEAC